jgi:hypothetical protein
MDFYRTKLMILEVRNGTVALCSKGSDQPRIHHFPGARQ